MTKGCKLLVGVFTLIGFLAPQVMAQDNTQGIALRSLKCCSHVEEQRRAEDPALGIAPRYLKYYSHANKVLAQEDPAFLTAFQTLQKEISTIDSTDKQAQLDAFMRFMPAIEEMTEITHYDTWYKDEGYRTLQLEVIFSYFSIYLPTADKGHYISVFKIFTDAIFSDSDDSESTRLLTVDEIMEKNQISNEDAQRLLTVWDKLHRNWPW